MKASDISPSAVDEDVVINLEMENIDNAEMVEITCDVEKDNDEPRYTLWHVDSSLNVYIWRHFVKCGKRPHPRSLKKYRYGCILGIPYSIKTFRSEDWDLKTSLNRGSFPTYKKSDQMV